MRKLTIAAITLCVSLSAAPARAGTTWTVDVLPGAIAANFASETFYATGEGTKEEMSLVASIPSIAAGISIDMPSGYIGLKAGTGLLLNSRTRSYIYYGTVSGSFEVERSVMLGPHLGIIHFSDPKWWGDADIDFSDSNGFMLGAHLAMGDKISYLLSIDYFSAVFDVEGTAPGWTTSEDELDMSGVAIQFGFRAMF